MIVGLDVDVRVVELDAHEALPRRRLEVLQDALVARVVGDDEQEVGVGGEQLGRLLDRQDAAVVAQRVDDDGRVLAGLDDLVEVADGAAAHGPRERPVHPHRLVTGQQVAPDEVGGGEVLVAGDGHELALELPRHVLDEAGLAAAGRTLQQHRQARRVGGLEHLGLVADRQVPRLGRGAVRRLDGGHRSIFAARARWSATQAKASRPSLTANPRPATPMTTRRTVGGARRTTIGPSRAPTSTPAPSGTRRSSGRRRRTRRSARRRRWRRRARRS